MCPMKAEKRWPALSPEQLRKRNVIQSQFLQSSRFVGRREKRGEYAALAHCLLQHRGWRGGAMAMPTPYPLEVLNLQPLLSPLCLDSRKDPGGSCIATCVFV